MSGHPSKPIHEKSFFFVLIFHFSGLVGRCLTDVDFHIGYTGIGRVGKCVSGPLAKAFS